MKIELRPIAQNNREECCALRVAPEQQVYVSPNEQSLQDAAQSPDIARAFAIYADEKMVGFTMFAFDENNEDPRDKYWLWRFMIDQSLQGKGYGKAALQEILAYFKENGADIVTLSTKESNTAALNLYHRFGFKENGDMNEDEIVLKLVL